MGKIVSVYEHFGWRTVSRNELNSWTEVPLCKKKADTHESGARYLLEGLTQAEFCVNRNYHTQSTKYLYTNESNWNTNSNTLEPNGPQHVISMSSPSSTLPSRLSHCIFISKRSLIFYNIFKLLAPIKLQTVQAGKCLYCVHIQVSIHDFRKCTLYQNIQQLILETYNW
jgi:hypothetical protein